MKIEYIKYVYLFSYMLVHAFLYASRNIFNPKSFESTYVELPDQLSQLVIHGNDAISG